MSHFPPQAIAKRVIKAIRDTFPVSHVAIMPQTRFQEDLALDRVAVLELAMVIETAFDTEFPRSAIARFKKVSDVTTYLIEHLSDTVTERPLLTSL